jgi:hypothetical protein
LSKNQLTYENEELQNIAKSIYKKSGFMNEFFQVFITLIELKLNK